MLLGTWVNKQTKSILHAIIKFPFKVFNYTMDPMGHSASAAGVFSAKLKEVGHIHTHLYTPYASEYISSSSAQSLNIFINCSCMQKAWIVVTLYTLTW